MTRHFEYLEIFTGNLSHLRRTTNKIEPLPETILKITRPDTQLPKSRAGGQGPYSRSHDHLGRSSEAKDRKTKKKVKCHKWTDRWMSGPMDGRANGLKKRGVESRSTRLKIELYITMKPK